MHENYIIVLPDQTDEATAKAIAKVIKYEYKCDVSLHKISKILLSQSTSFTPPACIKTFKDQQLVDLIESIVPKYFFSSSFSISHFASHLQMSRTHLHMKLKEIYGCSSSKFVNVTRLRKAKYLLSSTIQPIGQIAYSVGFSDPKYFSRRFKDYFGITPSDFIDNKCDT